MSALTSLLILLTFALMAAHISAQGGISDCCRKVSRTYVHRDTVKAYYKQGTHACPIEAVVFIHVTGKRICSKPYGLWTRTTMAYLDGKNYQQRQLVERHATAATPAAPVGLPTRWP